MLRLLKTRWELALILTVFVIAKLPALHYLFYADESWSYAPAVRLMYEHGPSLMPNAIDLFYSRGHPLLFYAAAATWMKVFSASALSQHTFALTISLLTITAVYETALRMYDRKIAALCAMTLCLQVIFFVQSTFLLPEVMIALLSVLTLYSYVSRKYMATFLYCTALVFTKESGMVLGLTLGICACIDLPAGKEPLINRVKGISSLAGAGVLIGCFYLLQKKINGWYLFPEHTGYIVWKWEPFWLKMRYSLEVIFLQDGRKWLTLLFLLISSVTAIKRKNAHYLAPLFTAAVIYLIVANRGSIIPRQVVFVLFIISLIYSSYILSKINTASSPQSQRFMILGAVFFVVYLSFSCINFFTVRYLICILTIMLIMLPASICLMAEAIHKVSYYPILICTAVAGIIGFKTTTGLGDVTLGAYDAMKVHEDIVRYFEGEQLYDRYIFSSFANKEHLQKPLTGFRMTTQPFPHAGFEITPQTEYLILDNIDSVTQFYEIKDNPAYHVVYRTGHGDAWGEVYKK